MAKTSMYFLLTLTFLFVGSFRTPTRRGRSFANVLDAAAPEGFHKRNQDDLAKKYVNGFLLFDSKRKAAEERKRNLNRRDYTCEKDGVIYEPYEQVPVPGCEQECYCPQYGGTIRCKPLRCPVPLCIDPAETLGSCCPSCQNGENCLVGDKVIAGYGLDIILPHGNCDKTCRCPGEETYKEQGEKTQAICTPLC